MTELRRVSTRCGSLDWVGLAPIVLLPLGGSGFGPLAKAAIVVATLVMLAAVLAARRSPCRRTNLKAQALLGLMLIQGLSMSFVYAGNSPLGGAADSQFFLYGLAVSGYISAFGVSLKFFKRFTRALDWSCAVFLIDLLYVLVTRGSLFYESGGVSRLSPSMGPSAGAIYLLFVYIYFLHLWLSARNRKRLVFVVMIFVLLALTSTRIVLLAGVTASAYMLWCHRLLGFNVRTALVAMSSAVLIVLTASRLFFEGEVGLQYINTNGRLLVWEALWGAFVDSPVLGRGLGVSTALMYRFGFNADFGIQPHNDYLRLILTVGVLGFGLFVALMVIVWKIVGGNANANRGLISPSLPRALLIALLIVMVTDNIFIYHFYIYPFWLVVFACSGAWMRGGRI